MNAPTSYLVHISDSLGICQFDRRVEVNFVDNTTPPNIQTVASCDGKGITFLPDASGTYIWNFGDGTPSIESNLGSIEHSYEAFDTYEVSVQHTTEDGCASTQVLAINVVSGIEANFDWSGENCTSTAIELVLEDQTKATQDSINTCLLYTSPSPRDATLSRMPSPA